MIPDGAHQVYRYNPINDSREPVIGLCVCDSCEDDIRQMQMQYYPGFFDSDAHSPVPSHWDPVEETQRIDRIFLYNSEQKFDDTVQKHFVYLNNLNDNYRVLPYKSCYFCKETIYEQNVTKIRYVEVPLEQHMHLIGGKVMVCERDFAELSLVNQLASVKCVRCGQSYRVRDDEYAALTAEGTLTFRMCPECTYKCVNDIVPYNILLAHVDNLKVRSTPITRLIQHQCEFCREWFVIDLCMSHVQLERQHLSANRIHCLTCYRLGITKTNGNKFYFRVHDNIFVLVLRNGSFWTYSICKLNNKKLETHLKSAINLTRDLTECILLGNEEAWKMFPITNQKEIWQ